MFHVYWPATAALTLFLILGVIMALLRYGPKFCKTRHVALPDDHLWQQPTDHSLFSKRQPMRVRHEAV